MSLLAAAKALFFLHPGGSIAKYYAECGLSLSRPRAHTWPVLYVCCFVNSRWFKQHLRFLAGNYGSDSDESSSDHDDRGNEDKG